MNILVAGAGITGFQVAKTLTQEGHDVVIMDSSLEAVREAANRLDCMTLHGRANNYSDLLRGGVEKMDYFVAMTGSDEVNIISCALVAAELPAVKTIARIRNTEYGRGRLNHTFDKGLTHIINPETTASLSILTSLVYGALSDVVTFEGVDIQVRNIVIRPGSRLHKERIGELAKNLNRRFLIPLIARKDQFLIPSGDTLIHEDDKLYIVADDEDFEFIFEALGKTQKPLKNVLIVGGGRISEAVAGYLTGVRVMDWIEEELPGLRELRGKSRVKIIENDYERCKQLAEDIPGILVINGEFSDENLFNEEHLEDSDVILTCTDKEERNLLAGIYAKRRGVKRAICLVYTSNYLSIAQQLDVDVAVSLKSTVVNSILSIIRGGKVEHVNSLGDGSVEILEFIVDMDSWIAGKQLMKIGFPPETLVIALQRGEESIIPRGATELKVDDRILVLTRKEYTQRLQNLIDAPVD